MCSYSMVADHYRGVFTAPQSPLSWQFAPSQLSQPGWLGNTPALSPDVTRAEFDQLKRDVENMKALLIRAKEYDAKNGEPDCEMAEKVALIKKVAELVGVDLSEVAP